MVVKRLARYGDWHSPIDLDTVTAQSRSLSAPRVSPSGRAFYVESRPQGGNTFMEITTDGVKDILPAQYSPSNKVYEYGGSLYDVLPDDHLIFSDQDGSIRLLSPDTGDVRLVTQNPVLRYCGFSANKANPWVLAIEEDHTHDAPTQIRNRLVAVNADTGKIKRIAESADFYFLPAFSHDGKEIAWLQWDRPHLVFDACQLYRADFRDDASLCNVRLVAGGNDASVTEPRWGPDGSLFFCMEADSAYRKLYRTQPKSDYAQCLELPDMETAEIGEVRLFEGSHTFTPLDERCVVASACTNGVVQIITIDLVKQTWQPTTGLQTICHVNFDAMTRFDDTSVLVVGAGPSRLPTLHKIDVRGAAHSQIIRESADLTFDPSWFSTPEAVELDSQGNPARKVFGFLWLPRNPKYASPEGKLPPLIISSHGGPTGYNGSGLSLRTQYFTTRGYAYLMLNYTGSTGHGRKYRQSLFGNWGVVDADDAAEAARQLVDQGKVQAGAVGITGPSAGGYNTLQALVRHATTFAGGFCICGISHLGLFENRTHKLEYDYTPALVLPHAGRDITPEEKDEIYAQRSAIFHYEQIQAPLFLLHGEADTIVPVEQATALADKMKATGKAVEILTVPDEGHMMSKPSSQRRWLEEEEKWWRQTLLE